MVYMYIYIYSWIQKEERERVNCYGCDSVDFFWVLCNVQAWRESIDVSIFCLLHLSLFAGLFRASTAFQSDVCGIVCKHGQ